MLYSWRIIFHRKGPEIIYENKHQTFALASDPVSVCGHTVRLMDFISELEKALGVKADINFMPMQPGDVYETYADTSKLERDFGYKPRVDLHTGIGRFAEWFKSDKNPLK